MTALAAAVAAVVAGCGGGTVVEGTPTSTATSQLDSLINNEQSRVEPTTAPSVTAPRTVDDIAADVRVFWVINQELPEAADVKFVRSDANIVCPGWDYTFENSTGVSCSEDLIMYQGPRVDALMSKPNGELAVEIIFAHEFGHALHAITGSNLATDTDTILTNEYGSAEARELSADCFAGLYMGTTGASSADIAEAIKLTKLGEENVRISAFNYGRSLNGEYAKKCLTTFGGKG